MEYDPNYTYICWNVKRTRKRRHALHGKEHEAELRREPGQLPRKPIPKLFDDFHFVIIQIIYVGINEASFMKRRFFRVKEMPPARRDREIADVLDSLRRVFKVVHRYSKRAEKVGGLTGPQVWAMKVLSEFAPIRVTDLARRMYLHPSTVVGILDRLEQQAQVARTRSEKDHRVVTVSLTAKGRETMAKVPQIAQGFLLKELKGLSDPDLSTVSEGLRRLVGILGVEGMPPPLLLSPEINVPGGKIDDPGNRTGEHA